MITGMFSPATLSAFSAGVSQVGAGQANLLQRVRAVASQARPPTATTVAPNPKGTPSPGQKLPRGSLLDLSV